MESMKPKPVEKPPPEEFAAGFRKQFLVNHSCISCDRPVKYAREGNFPPLPEMHSMPGSKSNRPYTTFELQQIRQHMLQGGLAMSKERFELLERQRNKLQKEILHLRLVSAHIVNTLTPTSIALTNISRDINIWGLEVDVWARSNTGETTIRKRSRILCSQWRLVYRKGRPI